ncbi:hypothetical protein V6N13_088589 [Hibiscus sabdariffa]
MLDEEPSKNEEPVKKHNPRETVPGMNNSTRVDDATTMVTGKVSQLVPKVYGKVDVVSGDILGAVMDPGLSGVVADHSVKGYDPSQIDEPMALALEDVDTSSTADDSLVSHPNQP